MIEDVTNLTARSVGTVVGYILNWLKAFFSEPENVLLSILIITTIWVTKMAHKRSDFYNRFQDVYKDLLTPSKVTLLPDLKYTQQKHPEWEGFISEVNKRIKYHPFRYKLRGLKEKVEEAVNKYERLKESFDDDVITIVDNELKKEDLSDYLKPKQIPSSIENINSGNPLQIDKGVVKSVGTPITKTSMDQSEKLRDLIDSVAKGVEVKKVITDRDEAKKKVDTALKEYNDKLAKVIQDLRFCRW